MEMSKGQFEFSLRHMIIRPQPLKPWHQSFSLQGVVVSLRSLRLPGGYRSLCDRSASQQDAADTASLRFTTLSTASRLNIFPLGTHQQEVKVLWAKAHLAYKAHCTRVVSCQNNWQASGYLMLEMIQWSSKAFPQIIEEKKCLTIIVFMKEPNNF